MKRRMNKRVFASLLSLCLLLSLLPTALATETTNEGSAELAVTETSEVISEAVTTELESSESEETGATPVATSEEADNNENTESITQEDSNTEDKLVLNVNNNQTYNYLLQAINGSGSDPVEVQLLTDIQLTDSGLHIGTNILSSGGESNTIITPKSVTIDLNGHKITNAPGFDTICVDAGYELTIKDSEGGGCVDNVSHGKAAVWNDGTCTLDGGTYTRSAENGKNAGDSGGNSFYTVLNHGTMTINESVTVLQDGHYSSLLENGYQNHASNNSRTGYVNGTNAEYPILTINGGRFTGGLNTVKNDDNGTVVIKGGTFENYTQSAFQNHHIATIDGGTFDGAEVYAVLNCGACSSIVEGHDAHETTINDGCFNGRIGVNVGSVKIKGGEFSDIASAVKYAEDGATVKLATDAAADVVVPAGKTLTLDLNGHTLTNISSDTVTVELGSTLTITDNEGGGCVDNVTHGKAAIWNDGDCTLDGGTYTRSAENGQNAGDSGGNSFYTVLNHGTMTINEGVTVLQNGHYSSLLENGYQNYASNSPRTGYVNGTNAEYPQLTINGGRFTGGLNTVKNDDNGAVTIKGGTFENYTQSAFQNHHIATINGGTFDGAKVYAVLNCGACSSIVADHDIHETTINSGYFNGNLQETVGSITINGGYFTADPSGYVVAGHSVIASTEAGYTYEVIDGDPETPDQTIFVVDKTEAEIPETVEISDEDKAAINSVINNADVDGVAEAVSTDKKTEIVEASGAAISGNAKVEIEVQVNVTVTAADLAKTTLTYEVSPVAVVKVDGTAVAPPVDLSNNYLNGRDITVRLPLPEEFNIKQIKHQFTSGGTEYFLDHQVRGAKVFTVSEDETYVEFTITGFSTFTLTGEETYVAPSSGGGGGGGSGSSSYSITAESSENGSVSVSPKSASKGTTVTITVKPDSGYELDELVVTDKNGDELKLTAKGDNKYTFTMPASKVNIEASFVKSTDTSSGSFQDVSSSAYYYDAVEWAVDKGITSGTSATTFSPNASCTRAQMVTFLWRAAGSPVVNYIMPFTDVDQDAYYAEAVRWAVSEGITAGTSDTTFSPDATVTRSQTVTFLYRNAGTPSTTGTTPFTDVATSAYYADAVSWAVAEEITAGTSATTFSPNDACTRAQIVTFLYREMAD